MLLKYNGISLDECLKNNPFQYKPFQLKNSFEFIEAVKYDKFIEMEIYLKNPDLLFSFDYYRQTGFHWAAKKNKIKGARLMIKYGNCVNQIDINHMTPLAIAAKNNVKRIRKTSHPNRQKIKKTPKTAKQPNIFRIFAVWCVKACVPQNVGL